MTRFSNLLLTAAFAASASALALAAPVAAKDKPAAGAQPQYSPEFIKVAGPAQTALKGTDPAAAETAVTAAEAAAKTDDDKYASSLMRVQLIGLKAKATGAQVDEAAYKAPLDSLIANPKTPAAQRAQFAYQRGAIAYHEKKSAEAVTYFNRAKELGYTDPEFPMALAQAKIDSGDVAGGTADLDGAIKAMEASGQKAPESYYRYALGLTVQKGMKPQSMEWIRRWVSAYPTAKNYHDALTIYGLQQGSLATLDKGQTVDLFRLMRQANALDQYGYEEYGQKVLDSGLPDEAKTVIAEGRAKGKVPTTGNGAQITADANKAIATEGSLAGLEAKARAGANGALASQTADAYLGKGEYPKAVELYRLALSKGGVNADQVNTHLGIALALSGDKAGAKTAFAAVSGAPRGDIAQFWVLWLDHPATA